MEIKEKKLQNSTIEFEISVPVERIKEEYTKTIKNVQRTAKIDGFRAGKAPVDLVEKKYKDKVNEQIVETIVKNTYFEALEEKQKHPITQPKIDFEDFSIDKDFKYKAIFEVYPTVELKDYKNISVEEKQVNVKNEDVTFEIDSLRDKHATISEKEENSAVEKTDLVKLKFRRVDYEKDAPAESNFSDMNVIAGKSDKEYDFDCYVIAMKKGEEKTIKFKYPKDFHVEDLAGKKVEYLIKVDDIKKRNIPAADDEFAKDLGEYDTYEELKKKTRENLEKYTKQKAKGDAKSEILKKIIEKASYDMPLSLIESEKNSIFSRMQQRMGFQIADRNIFAQAMGMKEEDFDKRLEEEALSSIKTTITLSEIARTEKIEVTDADYSKYVDDLCEKNNKSHEEMLKLIKQNNAEQNIKSELIFDKTLDFIYENAKIKLLSPVSAKEFMDIK